jgi:hypothetical protein
MVGSAAFKKILPHMAVQVDAPGLKPIIHFWAIHVAYLGKDSGLCGRDGLYHMLCGGSAARGGQIAGENDSVRLFQFGYLAHAAYTAVQVAYDHPCMRAFQTHR